MSQTVKDRSPLEWGGVSSDQQALLDRVILDRQGPALLVSDASSSQELFRVEAEELADRSLVTTLVHRLGEYYCTGCTALLDGPMCTACGKDRAKRLEAAIAMLESDE